MQFTKSGLSTPALLLVVGLGAVLVGAVLGDLVVIAFYTAALRQLGSNIDGSIFDSLSEYPATRAYLRLGVLFSTLFTFALPAIVTLYVVYRKNWVWAAGLSRRLRGEASGNDGVLDAPSTTASPIPAPHPRPRKIGFLALGICVASLPLIAWITYWNFNLPLPEWAARSEAQTDQLLGVLLRMETPGELLMALLCIGVAAGFGEEILLRGLLQNRILRPLLGNEHAAIWLAALVFSLMHWEFAGLLPRLLLGALLGYAYRWTRTLWWPIGLHVLFNGAQVVQVYRTGEFVTEPVWADLPAVWLTILATVLLALGIQWVEKLSDRGRVAN